jgi:hypothetical protein
MNIYPSRRLLSKGGLPSIFFPREILHEESSSHIFLSSSQASHNKSTRIFHRRFIPSTSPSGTSSRHNTELEPQQEKLNDRFLVVGNDCAQTITIPLRAPAPSSYFPIPPPQWLRCRTVDLCIHQSRTGLTGTSSCLMCNRCHNNSSRRTWDENISH